MDEHVYKSHNKTLLLYHFVFPAKYRKKIFDDKIDTTHRALGLHTFVSQVQGKNLISKNEIKIAAIFKKAPADFLQMIVVHELAHLKEKDHNKHFYRLCNHMMEDYDQMELDLRIYLIKLTLDQRDSSFPS
jgi:predicted metal-dependent hydrolase